MVTAGRHSNASLIAIALAARAALAVPEPESRSAHDAASLDRFYANRQQRLAWFRGGKPVPDAYDLVELVEGAGREGLEPKAYGGDSLRESLDTRAATREELAARDRILTAAALQLLGHMAMGCLDPSTRHGGFDSRRVDVVQVLEDGLSRGDLASAASDAAPRHPEYVALRRELERYRRIVREGGVAPLPDGPVVGPGDRMEPEHLDALRSRLAAEGYLADEPQDATAYGPQLQLMVAAFQTRHDLKPDGKLGPETRRALNVPMERRMAQIALAMERWRWLPDDLGAIHVRVNVPAFRLTIVENGRPSSTMPVIVGRHSWQTPIFATRITAIVLNPSWNVPVSIADEDLRRQVARSPGYLRSQGFQLVDDRTGRLAPMSSLDWDLIRSGRLRLRQQPGGRNALGHLKFVLDPNPYDVYFHDTPARGLFSRPRRALSHGCVRVERPLELAQRLLGDASPWAGTRIEESIAAGVRTSISVEPAIPAYLLYVTAEVIDGRLHFHPDVYGFDDEILTGDAGVAHLPSRRISEPRLSRR